MFLALGRTTHPEKMNILAQKLQEEIYFICFTPFRVMNFDPKIFLTKKRSNINQTIPLIYPESLVKIFRLQVDEIVADILQDQVSTEGCMDTWTTETLALAIQSDRSTTLWSGLKTMVQVQNLVFQHGPRLNPYISKEKCHAAAHTITRIVLQP